MKYLLIFVICILFSCKPPTIPMERESYSEKKSFAESLIFTNYNLQFEVGDTIIIYPLIDEDFGHARVAFSKANESYYSTQDKIMIEGKIIEKSKIYSNSNELTDILFTLNVTNLDRYGVLYNYSDTLKVSSVFNFKSSSYGRNLLKK